ncbi:MAG: DNA polymerase III subunit alpha [Ignavibacteriaceae bacterium]|nr:DNA polymerase III subunit alpha [Ignavibacteriaceae bacterium]
MSDFIHLHNHTHYSLQDGACTVDSLIDAAKRNNMKAVALTDHGVMYGISEFYRKAIKEGIKPIIGMEAYIVKEGSRFDRGKDDPTNKKRIKTYNHLLLLAKNNQGYKNLTKLSTLGHTEGYYYRPRIDLELLTKYKEGLICSSACAGGIVATHLVNNDYEKAKQTAKIYKQLFEDDFYLEIQDHGMEIEKAVLEGMPRLAKELNIKLVATNDCHYIEQEHAIPHNILLLLSDKNGADYNQLRYGTNQIYFKSSEEMIKLFKKYKGAIENTLEIESKINVELDFNQYHFPQFPIPEDSTAKSLDDYFELLAREGLKKKFPDPTQEILQRFEFELDTIKKMGFSVYFLIVQDFINSAKRSNIPVGPGRGSVAGSLVAFTLGITEIDPLKYSLLFERFLNPARKSMPDIDVDFADDKRGDIIEYVRQKYGTNSVSQIITFNRLSSKAVIRDVARVLKIPIPTVNKITKWIPSKFGKVFTIDQALNEVPELKWVKDSKEPEIRALIKYAKVLEGMNRNSSKHAAGIVITPGEVSDYVPLANAVSQSDIVTQFNMKDLEYAGLLKMDFLGLRTLTIIRDTISLVQKTHGVNIEIEKIPLDDDKTYQLFWKGQTTGIFQFESAPMREYLKKLKPTSINDLSAMNALYRPGPMDFIDDFIDRKQGVKNVVYQHPILENILKETYGVIVYQEQVIQIANRVGGMSLAEADILRRAMGKKDLAAMKQQKEKFIDGARANNIPKKVAEEIFESIDKFANYGFNKSHSVAYSLLAYQTAYLKAHYTPEFLAANLKNEFDDINKVTTFLEDCRKLKIQVLPPDVNNPSVYFDVENGKIKFGLSSIKNVGVSAVEEIIKSKTRLKRNFNTIFDFCENVDTRIVNKRSIESLIFAGAFDSINSDRASLNNAIELALSHANKLKNSKLSEENSLFGSSEEVKTVEPKLQPCKAWDQKFQLAKEREVIGFYVSEHPLRKFDLEYKSFASIHLGETEQLENMDIVRVGGVITGLKTKIDKSGKNMAFFTIDDFTGSCEAIMFSKTYDKYQKIVGAEECIFIIGKPESSGDSIKLQIEEAYSPSEVREKIFGSVKIFIDPERHSPEVISSLKKILVKYSGNIPVFVHLFNGVNGRNPHIYFLKDLRVKISDELITSIINLLGEDSILFNLK